MVTATLPEIDDYAASPVSRPAKRKQPDSDVADSDVIITHNPNTHLYNPLRAKRFSPFHNTPKQRREDRRRIIKVSAAKIRDIDDPELFLRRSVLVNNTYRRLRNEMAEERRCGYGSVGFVSSNPFEGPPLIAGCPSLCGPPAKRIVMEASDVNTNYLPYHYGLNTEDITDDLSDDLAKTVCDMNDTSNDASYDAESFGSQVPPAFKSTNFVQEPNQESKDLSVKAATEQQFLSEMDLMFNNLYNVISGAVASTS